MSDTSFARAQGRILERQRARAAEAQASYTALQSASRLRTALLSTSWPLAQRISGPLLSCWDTITSGTGTRPAFRVGQVDTELLDEELVDLLRGQVGDSLRYVGGLGSNIKDDWREEIGLLLRATLFKFSVWDHDATYGAALQNLRYTSARPHHGAADAPSRLQKSLYGAVTVVGPYAWTKWSDWLASQSDGLSSMDIRISRLLQITSALSSAHSAAALISFLAFLINGKYRTVVDRILGLRLTPASTQLGRDISFEYLNRQLVWHAFTEFLLFMLPLIGIYRLKRWFVRNWRRTKGFVITTTTGDGPTTDDDQPRGELAFLPERTCAICYHDQNSTKTEQELIAAAAVGAGGISGSALTDITNAYEATPCQCVYCFVCLVTRIEAEDGDGWTCLRCGQLVQECRPWDGGVLQTTAGMTTSKAVSGLC